MNVQIDVRVIIRGYQKFEIALIYGSYGIVSRFGRVKGRRLYRLCSENVELGTSGRLLPQTWSGSE
jgi:hypothetical protein